MGVYTEWKLQMSQDMGLTTSIKSICMKIIKKTPPDSLHVVVDKKGNIFSTDVIEIKCVP